MAPPRLIFFSMLPPPPLMPQENKFNSCTSLSFGVFILNSINCLFGIYKIMSYPHLLHFSTLRRNPFFRSTFYKFSICLILLLHHLVTTIYWNCTFFVPFHLLYSSNGPREWVSKSFVWWKRVGGSSSRSKYYPWLAGSGTIKYYKYLSFSGIWVLPLACLWYNQASPLDGRGLAVAAEASIWYNQAPPLDVMLNVMLIQIQIQIQM